MCEFCHKHGEGEKWYLRAQHYSDDLLNDLRRRKFIREFLSNPPEDLLEEERKFERVNRLPSFVRAVVKPLIIGRRKRTHYGQVVPIEDIDRMWDFVTSTVRLPCVCREALVGPDEQRYCYGFLMLPPEKKSQSGQKSSPIDASYRAGPNTSGFETLSKEQVFTSLRELEKKGLCHTVWTFMTPFIGGICNCDRSDCFALRATVSLDFPTMFRAEYVAEVNPDLCNGCRQCMRVCQFGAIRYSAALEKVVIDQRQCYGCGVCRANCTKDAIVLKDRSAVPVAANIW